MKLACDQNGEVEIEAEDPDDWMFLKSIVIDAVAAPEKLARQLAEAIQDPEIAGDWEDYVVEDLQQQFDEQVRVVYGAIEGAAKQAGGESGCVRIAKPERLAWYAVLNQARLSLEAQHHFGNRSLEELDVCGISEESRGAFLRSHDYMVLQSMFLDLGLE